ncbi:MAG: c-type cytochrome [Pseudomonadota bacterium]
MSMKAVWLGVAALSGAALAVPASGQPTPVPQARAEAIFAERCKECHDPAMERAPSRQELAARKPEEIVAAMTTGPMTPIAEGLTPEEKQALAVWLTSH